MQNTCSKKALDGISGCEPKIDTAQFWYIDDKGCLVTGKHVVTKTCNPTHVKNECFDSNGRLLDVCPEKVAVNFVVPAKCGEQCDRVPLGVVSSWTN